MTPNRLQAAGAVERGCSKRSTTTGRLLVVFFGGVQDHTKIHTADGKNPAPVDMVNIPLLTRFHACWVVQDFFHQQCWFDIFLFSPPFREESHFDEHIFQRGWNHHLVDIDHLNGQEQKSMIWQLIWPSFQSELELENLSPDSTHFPILFGNWKICHLRIFQTFLASFWGIFLSVKFQGVGRFVGLFYWDVLLVLSKWIG